MDIQVVTQMLIYISIAVVWVILSFLFITFYMSYLCEKRVAEYSMKLSEDDRGSIIDRLHDVFYVFVELFSKMVRRLPLLRKQALKFDKYLSYIENNSLNGTEYVSIKIIITLFVALSYSISTLLKYFRFNFSFFILLCVLTFVSLDIVIKYLYHKKEKLIESQLLQAIGIMNSAFTSGKNILGSICIVKKELPNPIREEFELIYKDISFGLDIETAFERFEKRVKIPEAKYITSSLSLLSKTGGNVITVFNMIEKNFYNKLKIRSELSSLLSSSKFLYKMLLILPIIFMLVIVLLNPTYFNPLFTTNIGLVISGIIIVIYIVYIIVVKKIMEVDEV